MPFLKTLLPLRWIIPQEDGGEILKKLHIV
jgi:hypothetical protein